MRLHSICYYRGNSDNWGDPDKWTEADFAARNLVKAVKRESFGGYTSMRFGQGWIKIDNSNQGNAAALRFASAGIAQKIVSAGYENAIVVPVPSSSHITPGEEFTCSRLADAIQSLNNSLVSSPVLHFNVQIPKDANGRGPRNPEVLRRHLRMTDCALAAPVILLDDVCTTGGHLVAAARFLRDRGIEVSDAFVIGRTIWSKPNKMFDFAMEELAV